MADRITDAEAAETIAETYAAEECVGTLGEVLEVTREESIWIVEFRTHTFSEAFVHRIKITAAVGNVITHDRNVAPA